MRILIAASLLFAMPARADAVAEILDQLKARIERAEKLADGKSRAPLKEELRAMRNDIERAQKVLATPTVPPPPASNPLPMPPPAMPSQQNRVSVKGRVRLATRCTQALCGPANRCCNQCTLVVHVTPDDGPFARRDVLVESGHGCEIDGCGKISGCALKNGEVAQISDVMVSCAGSDCSARK